MRLQVASNAMLRKYYIALYTSLKWFCVLMFGTSALFIALTLIDWMTPRWGYPLWLVPFLLVVLGIIYLIRRFAISTLEQLREEGRD
jgi:membrane protein implicated in regulation of membrane protease activity